MPLRVPTLEDGDLYLRPPERGDVETVTVACQDPDIARFTRIPSPYERAHAEAWIAHTADAWSDGTEAAFVVVDGARGLVGSVGLMRLDEGRAVAEIGYWVAKEARGRGIATRVMERTVPSSLLRALIFMASTLPQQCADGTGLAAEGPAAGDTGVRRRKRTRRRREGEMGEPGGPGETS